MPKKSMYEEDFDYENEDYEDPKRGIRKLRKEPEKVNKEKWEQESYYDRDHDYDERR